MIDELSRPAPPGEARAWQRLKSRLSGLARLSAASRSRAEDANFLLVVTHAPLQIAEPGVTLRTWGDPLPNFTDYVAVAVDVPADSGDRERLNSLLTELNFAAQSGALVVWLVSEDSSDEFVGSTIGLPFIRLREPSAAGTLKLLDDRLAGVVATIPSFRLVFRPSDPWVPLATVPTGGVSPILARRDRDTRLLTSLVLPIAQGAERAGTAVALARWVRSELRNRSQAEQGRRSLQRMAILLACFALIFSGARQLQRQQNLWIREHGQSSSPIEAYDLASLQTGDSEWDLPRDLLAAPNGNGEQAARLLRAAAVIGDFTRENALVEKLLDKDSGEDGEKTVGDYIRGSYPEMIDEAIESRDYEKARFLAQRFLVLSDRLPYWTGFQQYAQYELNAMRRIVDLCGRNYLFHDGDGAWLLAISAAGGDTDDVPPAVDVDTSLADNARYSELASVDASPEDWEAFSRQFVSSEKRDDAAFNAVNQSFDEPDLAMARARTFVADFPASYLADDALFYLVRLSVEQRDLSAALSAFRQLVLSYPGSDSLKRLQYLILRSQRWESNEAARAAVERVTRAAAAGEDVTHLLGMYLGELQGGEWNE